MTSSDSSSRSASSASTVKFSCRLARHLREFEQVGHQFLHHPVALGRDVARMQRRQLDRNAHPGRQRFLAGRLADRDDGVGVGFLVAPGIGRRARALAQHVEGMAIAGGLVLRRPRQRVPDGFAEHEMMAEEPHRLPGRRAHRRHAQPLDHAAHDQFRRLAGPYHPCRHAERPGRCGDEPGLAVRVDLAPVAFLELVLDQPVLRGGVGHAKQRLGEHHHGQPLGRRQAVLPQKILDPADRTRIVPYRLDVARRTLVDPGVRLVAQVQPGCEIGNQGVVVTGIRRCEAEGGLRKMGRSWAVSV